MQGAAVTLLLLLLLLHAGGPQPGGLPSPPARVPTGQLGPVGFVAVAALVFFRHDAALGRRETLGQRLGDGHGVLGGLQVVAGGHGRRGRVTVARAFDVIAI